MYCSSDHSACTSVTVDVLLHYFFNDYWNSLQINILKLVIWNLLTFVTTDSELSQFDYEISNRMLKVERLDSPSLSGEHFRKPT